MNTNDIRSLINDTSKSEVMLPMGEFEGPFEINRPCTIIGNNTTLWRKSGPVAAVHSRGVKFKNIHIEITDDCLNDFAVSTDAPDTVFENTVIYGMTSGVAGENGRWDIPKVIDSGIIPAGKEFIMLMEINIPAPADISVKITGVRVQPEHLEKGMNTVKIIAEPMSAGTIIYGDIELHSAVIRKIFLSMKADTGGSAVSGSYVYRAQASSQGNNNASPYVQSSGRALRFGGSASGEEAPKRAEHMAQPAQTSQTNQPEQPRPASQGSSVQSGKRALRFAGSSSSDKEGAALASSASSASASTKLLRGQRVNVSDILGSGDITAELTYQSMMIPLDIDAYTILLDEDNRTPDDSCLVFFGNSSAADGSVTYTDDGRSRIVRLSPARIPRLIQKIVIAYSIYGNDINKTFGKLRGAALVLKCGGRTAEFPIEGLDRENTIVAAELYRRGDIWKLSAVGQGYNDGLRKLCESVGLHIID